MQKIPKIIHYVWVGGNSKPPLVLKCIESWKRVMPDYEIKEWNEKNFDVNYNNYTQKAYKEKKWAFVSDVARLKALYEIGGIYLDTDMYVLKSFNDFLNFDLVLGKEDGKHISAGMIASVQKNIYIEEILNYYLEKDRFITIPKILTSIYNSKKVFFNEKMSIKIFDKSYFYPFSQDNISKFNYKNAPKESYAVHLWNYSWDHPLNKFIKKTGLHKFIKTFTEKIGIKDKIKKLLKMYL